MELGEVRPGVEALRFECLDDSVSGANRNHHTALDAQRERVVDGTLCPVDPDSSVDPRNRPRWQGELHFAAYPIASLEIGVRAFFVGSLKATSNPTGFRAISLDGWERIESTTIWTSRMGISIYLAIENLLDADYAEAVGFPAVGIYPRAGAKVTF